MGATAAPQITRTWADEVGSIAAMLSMEVNDGNVPAEVWFDWGQAPNLSDAQKIGDQPYGQPYGVFQSHATLGNLDVQTTYYFRATIRTSEGTVAGPIESFTTTPAGVPLAPSIVLEQVTTPYTNQGVVGSLCDFVADGHGWPGEVSAQWSKNADMSNPNPFPADAWGGPQQLAASPIGQHFYTFIGKDKFPPGATIYVQASASTTAGIENSEIAVVPVPA
jgi:hypothetical protein